MKALTGFAPYRKFQGVDCETYDYIEVLVSVCSCVHLICLLQQYVVYSFTVMLRLSCKIYCSSIPLLSHSFLHILSSWTICIV